MNILFKLSRFGMYIEDLMSQISKRVIYFLQESWKLCTLIQRVLCAMVLWNHVPVLCSQTPNYNEWNPAQGTSFCI